MIPESFRRLVRGVLPPVVFPGNAMARTIEQQKGVVCTGPFKGMKGIPQSSNGVGFTPPMLLGTFERELHPIIEAALQKSYVRVINVGAAEGYYAVGLALRSPRADVIAFELNPEAQETLREVAGLNGVADRVHVQGRCERENLEAALAGASECLVLCDVEGDEAVLLDPGAVPALRHAWILAELHEQAVPGIGEALEKRFQPTHDAEMVFAEPRAAKHYPLNPVLKWFPTRSWRPFLNEQRGCPMSWLWLQPRDRKD